MAITDLIPWRRNESRIPVKRWSEENALVDLRSRMNRMFDDFFERPFSLTPLFGGSSIWGNFAPNVDVSETEKEITIMAELSGMQLEDINVTLDSNNLIISGEKHAEKEEKGEKFYQLERSYGSFRRAIPFPMEVDEGKVDARFRRGVLRVKLPKTLDDQRKGGRITVETS